jgi:hypothetical protein
MEWNTMFPLARGKWWRGFLRHCPEAEPNARFFEGADVAHKNAISVKSLFNSPETSLFKLW